MFIGIWTNALDLGTLGRSQTPAFYVFPVTPEEVQFENVVNVQKFNGIKSTINIKGNRDPIRVSWSSFFNRSGESNKKFITNIASGTIGTGGAEAIEYLMGYNNLTENLVALSLLKSYEITGQPVYLLVSGSLNVNIIPMVRSIPVYITSFTYNFTNNGRIRYSITVDEDSRINNVDELSIKYYGR